MIFMSQCGLIEPGREGDWDRWYVEHLRIMSSVNGIESAQRFKTSASGYSPSLAMYSIQSPAVFEDPYYLSIRGLGEFASIVDRRFYRRNLFAGLDLAPAVLPEQRLLVWDASAPREAKGFDFAWLEAVAIDKSTLFRGIAVVDAPSAGRVPIELGIACYIPATAVCHK